MRALGLRSKSIIALLLSCSLAFIPAGLLAWRMVDAIRAHYGAAYATSSVKLFKEAVFARVSRELSLSQRFARSQATLAYLRDEDDAAKRAVFFREAESFRADFQDHSYFLVSHRNRYFNADNQPVVLAPRAATRADDPSIAWFFNTLRADQAFNLNASYDRFLGLTKVWINVVIDDEGKKLGVAGTGLDLTQLLHEFVQRSEKGLTQMIVNADGAIQMHPNVRLIALNSGTQQVQAGDSTIFKLAGSSADADALRQAMQNAARTPEVPSKLELMFEGRPQILALSYLPELRWYQVSAVDPNAVEVIKPVWLWSVGATLMVLFSALVLGFLYLTDKLLLQPIRALRSSAQAVADGNYSLSLPTDSKDELGELARAFARMARQVAQQTEELEQRVRERTAALEDANQRMRAAHKTIDDSINYASLIQRAVLPERELAEALGREHFVLWWPRDVVGGDFYVLRREADSCLVGVVDCAGHGVAGALMTMLGGAALEQAITSQGAQSPAAVLRHADNLVRGMLRDSELQKALASTMDAGLCYLDRPARTIRFAGAKVSLFWTDGSTIEEVKGNRRALGDRRVGEYGDVQIDALPGRTYYLVTDGVLDQAGGEHGFGFGSKGLQELLLQNAHLSMEEQGQRFSAALRAYRGSQPQRDDITVLAFRFDLG